MSARGEASRFMELEGLRGIAAIIVAVYHFFLAFYLVAFFGPAPGFVGQHLKIEDNLYGAPFMGLLSGTFAVAIFFVLSGFVLSIGFFQTGKTSIIKKLAIKRYPRLMIPALASVVICFVLFKLGASQIADASRVTQSGWLSGGWQFNPSFLDAVWHGIFGVFVDGKSAYNNVLWTMTTEFLGSFLVFVIALIFAGSKYRWIVYVALLGAFVTTWFAAFIIGMILADLFAHNKVTQAKRKWYLVAGLLALGVYLGGFPAGVVQGTSYAVFAPLLATPINPLVLTTTIGAGLVVFILLWTAQLAAVLRHRRVSVLGKYTFSLYLVHLPILYTLTTGVFLLAYDKIGYNKSVIVAFVVSVPIVAGAAYLFEKYVDRKAILFSSYCAALYLGERELEWRQKTADVWFSMRLKYELLRPSKSLSEQEVD